MPEPNAGRPPFPHDKEGIARFLEQYRGRLRRMLEVRMDPRVVSRIDPSDVIQDTITVATRRFGQFAQQTEVPVYVWLRKLAWERLVQLHRHHIAVQKRTVEVEARMGLGLSDASVSLLAHQLAADDTSPSARVVRDELHARVRKGLDELTENDREVLTLKHLERMTIVEIAATLSLSESAVQSRYRRAVERLHDQLADIEEELR